MDNNLFVNFTPLNSNNLADVYSPETIRSYYDQTGINPANNEFLQNYLGLKPKEVQTTSQTIPSVSTTDKKRNIDDIMSDIAKSIYQQANQPEPVQNQTTQQSTDNTVPKQSVSTPVTQGKVPKNKKEFLQIYAPLAKKAAQEVGLAEDLILAQIALETG